jgi:TfoX/Sxy family transcriptional regulator of competence genes
MAYDESLATRFRGALDGKSGISEKRMMGGVCFFVNGNMLGGADKSKEDVHRFMFRVGKDNEAWALKQSGARIIEQGGKRMGGMVFVDAAVCNKQQLQRWVEKAQSFVATLPSK